MFVASFFHIQSVGLFLFSCDFHLDVLLYFTSTSSSLSFYRQPPWLEFHSREQVNWFENEKSSKYPTGVDG